VTETSGPLPPLTVTFPTWLTITTVLTGVVIWYLDVAWCVPGTDRPGLALSVAVPGDEPALGDEEDDVHPTRLGPAIPSNPVISASDPARRIAAAGPLARSMRDKYPASRVYSSKRPSRYLARKRSAAA
jgi:hypothetical protein